MARRRHTPEQVIKKLREAEVAIAERAAQLRAQAPRAGHTLHLADALIAGTAVVHKLILATHNDKDFAALDIEFVDPWESP